MALRKGRSGSARRRSTPRVRRTGIQVSDEERSHMIECCAFFNAARHRPTRPGGYRREDLADAAARIDAILAKHGGVRRSGARRIPREGSDRKHEKR